MQAQQKKLEEYGTEAPPASPPPVPVSPRPEGLPGIWQVKDGYVEHPMLESRVLRALPFQIDFARVGLSEDLLVVLPTGLGKTVIAALLGAEVLRRGSGKILVVAPTRPLVQQHYDSFGRWFRHVRRARFTGTVRRPVREGAWEGAEAVFATPQIVVNDLEAKRYDLRDVGLLVVDEAHRAVGRYAYVPIAGQYREERALGARLLGLTASPGGQDERIEAVVSLLGVQRVEARTREDEGVREYVQPVELEFRWVNLTVPVRGIQEALRTASFEVARKLQRMGYLRKKPIRALSVKDLISLRAEIFARPGPMTRKFGPLFHQLVLLHLHHAQDRLETQGVEPFLQYLERLEKKPKPSRGDQAVLKNPLVARAREAGRTYLEQTRERSHPKLDALVELVEEELARPRDHPPRVLVFAQYRDTIQGIQETLEARDWRVGRFVGQATRVATDKGMNQREQAAVLEAFRAGRFPVLVASSVAEEGLDVPNVDLVVFFEPVPSEIRAIQRRGRTGRTALGRVVVLLTHETRDIGYHKAEVRRERAMSRIVRRLSVQGRKRRLKETMGRARASPAPEGSAGETPESEVGATGSAVAEPPDPDERPV